MLCGPGKHFRSGGTNTLRQLQVLTCLWMDDAAEVELWSAAPALAFFAARAWSPVSLTRQILQEHAAAMCKAIAGVDARAYIVASGIDIPPGMEPGQGTSNIGKWLLWEDPLLQHLSLRTVTINISTYFADLADWLETANTARDTSSKSPENTQQAVPRDDALAFASRLAHTLALKTAWQAQVRRVYMDGDLQQMEARVAGPQLQDLMIAVDGLWQQHRDRWLAYFKPFGLEVLEVRYGTLRSRLETARFRLSEWVASGGTEKIEELEELMIDPYPHLSLSNSPTLCWGRAVTSAMPSVIHDSLCPLI